MEIENESSGLSSPSESDIDEFYSLPPSPVMLGPDVPSSSFPSFNRAVTSDSSSSSPTNPPGVLPQVEVKDNIWTHPYQIDLDHSPFSRMRNSTINNLKMIFYFYVDEAFPFTTDLICAPFYQAGRLIIINPEMGDMIYHEASSEHHPVPLQFSGDALQVATSSRIGIENAVLNNVSFVYATTNSKSNPDFKFEQLKIWAPFYKSKNIVLNNPVIQFVTIIKNGGERHQCLFEKLPPKIATWVPFFEAGPVRILNGNLRVTVLEGQTLFNCPCLRSSTANEYFYSCPFVEIDSSNLIELIHKVPKKHTSHPGLSQHSMTGIELQSPLRWPHPRCHKGTRSYLLEKILAWLVDDNRKKNALWLHGDAGSGKSAVAQSVGENADQRGILGAAGFISRSKKLNDSKKIIPSIAFQLSQCNEAYSHIVTEVIRDNPGILNITVNMRTQFEELMLQPFSRMEKESPDQKKTLIIIDGLDEIDGKLAQSDLIDLIGEILHPSYNSPFIWLLCSRSELHLHDAFRRYENRILYQAIVTSPDANDAPKDVERFYLEELHHLKQENSNCFAADTNRLGETTDFLSHVRSNSFLYASTLVRVIGGPGVSNPASRLEAVLELVEHPMKNYTAIDLLYLHILQTIPRERESTALQLLGALTVSTLIRALYLAAILGITRDDFYSILEPLHPVLLVPSQDKYETEPLRFYHVSFPDFLINPDYAKEFYQDPNLSRVRLAEAQLRVIASPAVLGSHIRQHHPFYSPLKLSYDDIFTRKPFYDDISTLQPSYDDILTLKLPYHDILIHATKTTWDICSQISHPPHQWLRDTLLNFNFQCLQDVSEDIPKYSFMHFLWWLQESVQNIQELRDIVRTSPKSSIDTRFIRACEQYPSHSYRRRQSIASPFPWRRGDVDEILKEPRFALAGFGVQTVLILLTPETVMIFSEEDIDDL